MIRRGAIVRATTLFQKDSSAFRTDHGFRFFLLNPPTTVVFRQGIFGRVNAFNAKRSLLASESSALTTTDIYIESGAAKRQQSSPDGLPLLLPPSSQQRLIISKDDGKQVEDTRKAR